MEDELSQPLRCGDLILDLRRLDGVLTSTAGVPGSVTRVDVLGSQQRQPASFDTLLHTQAHFILG